MATTFRPLLKFDSVAINTYLDAMSNMAENTVKTSRSRLAMLPEFAKVKYSMEIDSLFNAIKSGKVDRYAVLASYAAFIKQVKKKSDNRVRRLVKAFRQLLEYHDIEISTRQFQIKVRLPREVKRVKSPVDIQTIREVLLACPDVKLKTFVMLLAATGMRPIEACSILHKDIHLKSKPATITIRAEYTKMKVERYVYLTSELAKQITEFMDYKLRERWQPVKDKAGAYHDEKIKPVLRGEDLLFAPYRRDGSAPKIPSIYTEYLVRIEQVLDDLGRHERDQTGRVRKFHFYSLRRFAKSTISDMGYGDFSEWALGHSGSPYYERSEKDRIEVFKRIEPALTFLDISSIESSHADLRSEIESLKRRLANVKEEVANMPNTVETMTVKNRVVAMATRVKEKEQSYEEYEKMVNRAVAKALKELEGS